MSILQNIPNSAYSSLADIVEPGTYSLYTGRTDLPPQLTECALPLGDKFYGVLIGASNSSQNPPTIGGIRPMPGLPVYAQNVIRFDPGHGGRHTPHGNVDRSLRFTGENFRAYCLSFEEHPALPPSER
jgi:hypothetical protein